jgi:hypothetical protein
MSSIKYAKLVFAIVLAVAIIPATATTLAPNPMLDISGQGLKLESGGAGLEGGAGVITVNIGGPVVKAILYWAGRDFPCTEDGGGNCVISGADDELLVDGTVVMGGRIVGTEINLANLAKTNNIGYAADVTGLVAAKGTGTQNFAVSDNDTDDLWRLNGAGLLIVYTDPADTDFYRVVVYEGLDFAYEPARPDAATVTEPVTIPYEATDASRSATVTVFAGDGVANRPDTIIIDGMSIFNALDGDEGPGYDVDTFPITIPAAATSTTIQLFSETNAQLATNPDSLLWEVGALQLPLPGEEGALGRMTGGRNIEIDGAKVGGAHGGMTIHCDITLSNNIQVSWGKGNTGHRWHLDKPITSAICIDDPSLDPTPPRAPFDTFIGEGIGKLDGEDGSAIRFTFIDDGEPGTSDYMEVRIWAPGDDPETDPVYFSAAGFLIGGNIQAHYDQPHNGNGNK